jgi:hypothetical protein
MKFRLMIISVIIITFILAVDYAWHWWVTPPCVQFFNLHSTELSQYSFDLFLKHDTLTDNFPLSDLVKNSKVNWVDLHIDSIDYMYYRWYTFPDGPMDHLVFTKSDMSTDEVKVLEYIRKPVHKVKKLSEHWFYVETE